jgi:hypothetical protein
MAKLPTVSSDIPRDLRQFVERVREALNGTGQDEIVTVRKLVAAGIAAYSNGGVSVPVNNNCSYPPAPSGVEASGALANIIVTWNKPIYACHAYAEIYAAEELEDGSAPVIGDAELIGMAPGSVFVHNIGAAATRWYWVRFVNTAGEIGPYNATDGIEASTGQDAGYLLEVLTGEITQNQLYSDLSTRVDRIDGKTRVFYQDTAPTGTEDFPLVVGDLWVDSNRTYFDDYTEGDYEILSNRLYRWDGSNWVEAMDYGARDFFTSINTEKTERIADGVALGERIDTVQAGVEGVDGKVDQEAYVRAQADAVNAGLISTLTGTVTNNKTITDAWITEEKGIAANATQAVADSLESLRATYLDPTTGSVWGAITQEATTAAEATGALALRVDTIQANYVTTGQQTAAINAAIQIESGARANAIEAVAEQYETLEANINDDINAAVSVEAAARANADGTINSKYAVKVDNAGHVAGFGLIGNGNAATPEFEFGVRADNFWIAPPAVIKSSAPTTNLYDGKVWVDTSGATNVTKYYDSGNWVLTPQSLPFVVRTSPTTINGEAVPAGVYMTDAFIANGTITNAKIGNAAIDNAKIANVDAGKITTGYLDANRIQAGSITANMIDSRGLSIKDANGNIILAAGSPLSASNVSGLGTLATADNITMSSVTDAGDLATKNTVPTVTNFTGGEELYNGTHEFVDINGYPAGILCAGYEDIPVTAALGTHDRNADLEYSDLSNRIISFRPWNITISTIYYPAFKVNPGTTYTVTIRMKTSTSGPIMYGYGLRSSNVDLTSGNTVIGDASGNYVAEDGIQNKTNNDVSNNNLTTALGSFVDKTFTYTPQSDAKWASVYLMCQVGTVFIERVSVVNNSTVGATFGVDINGQITSTNVSTYIADAAIGNAQIQNATIDVAKIDTATITDLNSFTANIGTVTAGKMESSDGKMVVDLDNKFIKIEV